MQHLQRTLIILCTLLIASPSWSRTAAFEDSTAKETIARVLELAFLLQYEEAFAELDTLEMILPDNTVVPLLRAGVYYCRTLDHEDEVDMSDFEQQYDKAWHSAELLKASGEIAEADLYFGMMLGFRALLHQRQDKWWPAVREGMKSVKYLKSCLRADSSYTDALLGVGTYKYWSSRATDFINWLPLIPDQKNKGLDLMRRAMDEGLFTREISMSTLAWTLIDYNRPAEAVDLSLEGLKKYPGSRFFLWTLAAGYSRMQKLEEAAPVYIELYNSTVALERNNHYNEMGICKSLGKIYLKLNRPEEALIWIEKGLNIELDSQVLERRKETIKTLKNLDKRARKQIQKKAGN